MFGILSSFSKYQAPNYTNSINQNVISFHTQFLYNYRTMKRRLRFLPAILYLFLLQPALGQALKLQKPAPSKSTFSSPKSIPLQQFNAVTPLQADPASPRYLLNPDSLSGRANSLHFWANRPNSSALYKPADPNKGSLDPGIFYAPKEPATPASNIIKPLIAVDPEMVVNPDDNRK